MTSYVPLFVFVFVSITFSICEANFAFVLTSWVPATRCQSWKWFPLVVHSHKTAGWWQDFLAFNLKHESRRTFLEVEINQSFADSWYIWRCIVFWKEIKKNDKSLRGKIQGMELLASGPKLLLKNFYFSLSLLVIYFGIPCIESRQTVSTFDLLLSWQHHQHLVKQPGAGFLKHSNQFKCSSNINRWKILM